MAVYLIPLHQAERVSEIPLDFWAEAWENRNPLFLEYGPSAWTTEETLDGLRALDLEPKVLARAEELPVFHGLMSYVDTCKYGPALSALCIATVYGPEIKGITYVGYGCERDVLRYYWALEEPFFFCYSRKKFRRFIWLALRRREEVEWALKDLWNDDENFSAWLKTLAF